MLDTSSVAPSASWTLSTSDGGAATNVRRAFAEMARVHVARACDTSIAELVLGEMIGNACRHAPGRVEVGVEWFDRSVALSVTNEGTAFELQTQPQEDLMAERGRGIFLVRHFASNLDVSCDGFGRCTVRAELPHSTFAAAA